MSMFKTTLRIKTDTPEGRKALGYLRNRDKTMYRSYSDVIIAAVIRTARAFLDSLIKMPP